jgi:hypothetical protein
MLRLIFMAENSRWDAVPWQKRVAHFGGENDRIERTAL